ncbi:MAG: DEAD/DEAH box helicase family protein [Niameybacter sp.]
MSIKKAQSIDIIVSFLMESGVKLLLGDLKEAINRGVKIRLLTGNYLHITEPSALYLIREVLGEQLDLRLYNVPNKSFHPKAYMFHGESDSEIYVGSSNISRGALTKSVEWNYRFNKSSNPVDFNHFYDTFVDLFQHHSTPVTDDVLEAYSKSWSKPRIFSKPQEQADWDAEQGVVVPLGEENTAEDGRAERQVINLYEPRGAQIEALYALKHTREEGWDRGMVVAATGIGKTYLAAFDSQTYKRVLFVAHREEILNQAEDSFKKVRQIENTGFFYNDRKDTEAEATFALVQTLGKEKYLNQAFFAKDTFDYIVIDECHHATAKQYEAIRNYFKPKFWLFLTATPTRLDNEDVFEIANYNTVYEVRLQEAINKDWLVPFRYYGVYDDTVNYDEIAMRNGKYDTEALDAGLMATQRADLVLKHYLKYNSKRAMGFCSSKAHAEYMANYFKQNKIKVAAVYSGEQGKMAMDRVEALDKLEKGELQVVFSVDMFNEGVDVPSIDMVLFLRPTESEVIFLQQLGRGLRKHKNKEYLIVLDFIGNYKKANLMPFLLGTKAYTEQEKRKENPQNMALPEGCLIDFDFRLIDLFKEMGKKQRDLRDCILEAYEVIKQDREERPTRTVLYSHMEQELYARMKGRTKENVLNDYLSFLKETGDLNKEEERLLGSRAGDFINRIENTDMSRTYKMPLLLSFYNEGNIRLKVTEDDVLQSYRNFYDTESNNIDLLQDKSGQDYKNWDDKRWMKLIKDNPVNALLNSASDFFRQEEGYVLTLDECLLPFLELETFKMHFKDAIDYRLTKYYRERFNKKMEKKKKE